VHVSNADRLTACSSPGGALLCPPAAPNCTNTPTAPCEIRHTYKHRAPYREGWLHTRAPSHLTDTSVNTRTPLPVRRPIENTPHPPSLYAAPCVRTAYLAVLYTLPVRCPLRAHGVSHGDVRGG
jgi:hypothetical protein